MKTLRRLLKWEEFSEENIKMENRSLFDLKLLLKGFAMGMAEIIPGVSGGTIAFITGIYEELLNTIKGVNFSLIKILRKQGLKAFWKALNGNFLVSLLFGMFSGLILGIFLIGFLLEHYQAPLWAFFFGLIISSAIYIGRQISKWSILNILLLIVGVAVAYIITVLSPSE
jgi:putative membrane protein